MPMSSRRGTAPAALLVCSVLKTRWPVSAARMASWAVSWSRISPTSRMSGILAQDGAQALGEGEALALWICAWLMTGSSYSTGSSSVMIFVSGLFRMCERRVERGGLAGAGGPGHQDDAVAAA
jgi:hypothetical protein